MTKNQYIKDNGYMAWLGRESLNSEVKCLLGSFGVSLTNKQVNCFSEMIEKHIKRRDRLPLDIVVPCVSIQSKEWSSIVEYCSGHAEDIENDIDDFATLRPIWYFMTGDRK